MAETPWKDQYTLLCEQCGYVLEGLETADPCPECGKPIAESLPIDRPGTPWQQKHSILTLLKTWYGVLRHPKRTFDEMDSIEQDGMSLTAVGLCFAIAVQILTLIVLNLVYSNFQDLVSATFLNCFAGIIFWVMAFVYAWIAAYRIRATARKKYRISSDISWAIVGHSSIGLCLPPIVLFLNVFLISSIILIEPYLSSSFDSPISIFAGIAYFAFFASFPVGLFYFEIMCTIGIRRCKFRNQENPLSWDLSEPSQSDARTT